MPDLLTGFGLIAIVLLVSALASGLVERAPLSFPIIFLGFGVLLGQGGLGLLAVGPRDATLEAVAVLTLALVLFLDAVKLQFGDGRRAWVVPVLTLGPGTFLIIGLVTLAAMLLLGLEPVPALLLGAILASTDPVVLRDVVRDTRVPRSVRRALTMEAGMNDIVVLPIILILTAIATAHVGGLTDWLDFLVRLFLVGPLAGFAVGGFGSWAMARVDARVSIRREYQALYGIGLVLAAYVAGVAVGGDGFLAAFAAGAAVVVLNTELCDCFLEYGETTAEMAMLLAFILFGALLSTLITTVPLLPTLLLAGLIIVVARPAAILLVLSRLAISWRARAFIGWFGPRGLNSLLFALLAVRDGVPAGEYLLAITGVVVLVSVVLHGVTATPLAAWYGRQVAHETLNEERESTAGGLFQQPADAVARITPAELARRLAEPAPPLVLDVRTRSSYVPEEGQIPGSIRVLPDQVAEWAATAPRDRLLVTYCT